MSAVTVNVNFSTNPPTLSPDPVTVSEAAHDDGITWVSQTSGYTFTGVTITPNPSGEFGTPSISTNASGLSQMTVTDSISDYDEHKYTLNYTSPAGTPESYDPKIRNEH